MSWTTKLMGIVLIMIGAYTAYRWQSGAATGDESEA